MKTMTNCKHCRQKHITDYPYVIYECVDCKTRIIAGETYSDPFGLRKITMGGDEPGLQSEIDWIKRIHDESE